MQSTRMLHVRMHAWAPDVPPELLDDLEASPSSSPGADIRPRTAARFSSGFRGYFEPRAGPKFYASHAAAVGAVPAASTSMSAQLTVPGQQLDASNGGAARSEQLLALLSGQGASVDPDAWVQQQLQAANDTVQVAALVAGAALAAGLGKSAPRISAAAPSTSSSRANAASPPPRLLHMHTLEQVVLRLQQVRGPWQRGQKQRSGGAAEREEDAWEALGARLSQLMALKCEAAASQPGHSSASHSGAMASALEAAAATGQVDGAVAVVQGMAMLGPAFYCKPYVESVISAVLNQEGGPAAAGPVTLPRCLAACAACGHLLRRSHVTAISAALSGMLSQMQPPEVTASLWSLTKYTVDVSQLAVTQGGPSFLAAALQQLEQRRFAGMTPFSTGQLLAVIQGSGSRPDPDWLDACLAAAMQATGAGAGSASLAKSAQPDVFGVVQLLSALAKLNYQPPKEVSAAMLSVLQQAMTNSGASPSTPAMPAQAVADVATQLVRLRVPASAEWCAAAIGAVIRAPSTRNSGRAACQLLSTLPALLGSNPAFLKAWVSDTLPQLELLTAGLASHLRAARPRELKDVIVGCASLRYHPGRQFMQWHQAACLRLGADFPWADLVMVRGAYSSLGFQPERRLVEVMERAQRKLQKLQRMQERRAAKAVDVAVAPIGPRKQGAARRPALRWSMRRMPGTAESAVDFTGSDDREDGGSSSSQEDEISALLDELRTS